MVWGQSDIRFYRKNYLRFPAGHLPPQGFFTYSVKCSPLFSMSVKTDFLMSAKSILFHTFKAFPSNDLQAFIELFNVMFVLLFSTYIILLLNLLRENAIIHWESLVLINTQDHDELFHRFLQNLRNQLKNEMCAPPMPNSFKNSWVD